MHKINSNKNILHKIEIIRENLSDLKKEKEIQNNPKTEKNIKKIETQLDNIYYYYGINYDNEDLNMPIKKIITIKSNKQTSSFFKWIFNNYEM